MENGTFNKDSVRKLVQEALDRINSEPVKQSEAFDKKLGAELQSARILLEVVIRDYLK